MAGFVMCPKCGRFMETSENSHAIICHHCGTLHTISPDSNKAIYSKHIHPNNSRPSYTPKYSLKQLYILSYAKIDAIPSYKLHLAQRRIFQTACRVMNRGLYAQALDFFAIIPNFDGVSAKVQECRQLIEHTQPVHNTNAAQNQPIHNTKTIPSNERKSDLATIFGALLQGLVMWLIFEIIGVLLK